MEYSGDEVRRQLVASKAQLLGASSRRGFLKIGGATVIGAAVMAACSSDGGNVVESGAASNLTTTTADPAAGDLDAQLLRTATSLEISAFDTYQAVMDASVISSAAVLEAATLFRDQHDDHRAALQGATFDLTQDEATEYTEPNSFLQESLIDPGLATLTDQDSAIELLLALETTIAETYVWSTGEFSTTTLRQAIMGIGGITARYMAVLRGFIDEDQVPDAFLPIDDRIPEDALVENEEAADEGDTTTTTEGDTTTTTGADSTTTTAPDTTTTSAADATTTTAPS